MRKLKERTAFITGGASGIGLAESLAGDLGADPVLHGYPEAP